MKNSALVSVIVPVFNQEKFVGRCLRSLLSQNFPLENYEIIVVNDGSTDSTELAIKPFADQITILRHDQNRGLPATLNYGLRNATTPFVVRVDSDDYVNENFLLFLYTFLQKNPDMDAISCDYILVDENELFIERKNALEDPIACGIMFRLEQLIEIDLYDEDFLVHEERDLRIRFLAKYDIHRLQLPLYRYRMHDTNLTKNITEYQVHMKRLVKKHGEGAAE